MAKWTIHRIIFNLLPDRCCGPHLVVLRGKPVEVRAFGQEGDWWSVESCLLHRPPCAVRRACDRAMRLSVDQLHRAGVEVDGVYDPEPVEEEPVVEYRSTRVVVAPGLEAFMAMLRMLRGK